jgi:hypothetical protein
MKSCGHLRVRTRSCTEHEAVCASKSANITLVAMSLRTNPRSSSFYPQGESRSGNGCDRSLAYLESWKAMSLPDNQGRPPARSKKAPVRVKLERINCDVGKLRPPDGDRQAWIDRLKAVLGTASTSSSMRPLSAPGGSAPAQQRGVGDRGERRIGLYRGRAAERGNRMRDRSPNGLRACGYNGRSRPAWWGTWRRSPRLGGSDSGKSVVTHFCDLGRDVTQVEKRRIADHSDRKSRSPRWRSSGDRQC